MQVAVPLPDVKGRAEILEYYLSDKPVAAGLDQSLLARQTSGFSGADLSNLVGSVGLMFCYVVLCSAAVNQVALLVLTAAQMCSKVDASRTTNHACYSQGHTCRSYPVCCPSGVELHVNEAALLAAKRGAGAILAEMVDYAYDKVF
jgi:ATP-dependent Zn protease